MELLTKKYIENAKKLLQNPIPSPPQRATPPPVAGAACGWGGCKVVIYNRPSGRTMCRSGFTKPTNQVTATEIGFKFQIEFAGTGRIEDKCVLNVGLTFAFGSACNRAGYGTGTIAGEISGSVLVDNKTD